MKGGGHAAAQARREEYCRLRDEGQHISSAFAQACGGDGNWDTACRHERWYQALKRGEQPVPGRVGRPQGKCATGKKEDQS